MPTEFIIKLERILSDVSVLTGFELLWKDVDPVYYLQQSRQFSEHQAAYCQAVKKDSVWLRYCCSADGCSQYERRFAEEPAWYTCHAGVTELRLAISWQGSLCGVLYLGTFRSSRAALPGLTKSFAQLTAPDCDKALCALRLARHCIEALLPLRSQLQTHAAGSASEKAADQIFEIIRTQARADLRIKVLSQRVHISESRLIHVIKTRFGCTFQALRLRTVMERAQRLLLSEQLSLSEIANLLGYCNPAYFSAAFKHYTGQTPTEFRANASKLP